MDLMNRIMRQYADQSGQSGRKVEDAVKREMANSIADTLLGLMQGKDGEPATLDTQDTGGEKKKADAAARWNNRTLPDLGELVDESLDSNVLFRHNWLARGQAFALVASSGVGKSSMADQMALHWALGLDFLASPTRPLKISVIQFEDSDRDLQEQRDGMVAGMRSEGISEEDIGRAMDSVKFPTDFIGLTGEAFLDKLEEYQSDCMRDMLIINPLQRCYGGDVSKQDEVAKFTARLDKILKSPYYGCAAGIVMHTPKFHSGVKDNRQSVDDFAEYAMAGSQDWTAWIRAVINFQKHGASEDYFDIKASKRGRRLGWETADAEGNPIPTTKRIFKHSEGYIYWQEVTDPEEIASIPQAAPLPVGAKRKEDLDIKASARAIAYHHREQAVGKTREAFASEFHSADGRKHRKADYLAVFDELAGNAEEYGFKKAVITSGNRTKITVLQ